MTFFLFYTSINISNYDMENGLVKAIDELVTLPRHIYKSDNSSFSIGIHTMFLASDIFLVETHFQIY